MAAWHRTSDRAVLQLESPRVTTAWGLQSFSVQPGILPESHRDAPVF